MNSFQYVTAGSSDEAISLIGKNGRYLAGGIDLLGEMKDYIVSPDVLVNVKDIKDQSPNIQPLSESSIKISNAPPDVWYIRSLTTISELSEHPDIKAKLPGLAEAASEVNLPRSAMSHRLEAIYCNIPAAGITANPTSFASSEAAAPVMRKMAKISIRLSSVVAPALLLLPLIWASYLLLLMHSFTFMRIPLVRVTA